MEESTAKELLEEIRKLRTDVSASLEKIRSELEQARTARAERRPFSKPFGRPGDSRPDSQGGFSRYPRPYGKPYGKPQFGKPRFGGGDRQSFGDRSGDRSGSERESKPFWQKRRREGGRDRD